MRYICLFWHDFRSFLPFIVLVAVVVVVVVMGMESWFAKPKCLVVILVSYTNHSTSKENPPTNRMTGKSIPNVGLGGSSVLEQIADRQMDGRTDIQTHNKLCFQNGREKAPVEALTSVRNGKQIFNIDFNFFHVLFELPGLTPPSKKRSKDLLLFFCSNEKSKILIRLYLQNSCKVFQTWKNLFLAIWNHEIVYILHMYLMFV